MRIRHAVAFFTLCLAGCATRLDVKAPVAGVFSPEPPAASLSTVAVPVAIPLDVLQRLIESRVPAGEDREAPELALQVSEVGLAPSCLVPTPFGCAVANPVRPTTGLYASYYWERDPFRLRGDGDRLLGSTELRYRLKGWAGLTGASRGLACGHGDEWPRRLQLSVSGALHWQQQGYGLVPELQLERLVADSETPCDITFLNIGIHNLLRRRVAGLLGEQLAESGQRLATVLDLTERAGQAWSVLQQPLLLDDAQGLYLVLDPIALSASDFQVDTAAVHVVLGLSARPQLHFGPRPQPELRPLPQRRDRDDASGFHLSVETVLPYPRLEALLNERFAGQRYQALRHDLIVSNVRTYPAAGKIVIEVAVDGDATGRIYFEGTPAIDSARGEIVLRDFDFSAETSRVLLNTAGWVFQTRIRDALAERARWPYRMVVQEQQERLTRLLNQTLVAGSHSVTLRGRIDTLAPSAIYPAADGVVIRIGSDGTLSAEIGD